MIFRQLALASLFLGNNLAPVAAGTGDIQTGTEVDFAQQSGFDSVIFIALLGAVTSTGVATLTVKGSDTSGTYGSGTVDTYTDPTTGAVVSAVGTTGDSNKTLVVDIYKPARRYARAQIQRATANVVINGMVAILYNSRISPVTQLSAQVPTAGLSVVGDPVPSAT